MSLINDMLRDLEARRPEGGRDALQGVNAVGRGRRWRWAWMGAIVVLTVTSGGAALWAAYGPMSPDGSDQARSGAPGRTDVPPILPAPVLAADGNDPAGQGEPADEPAGTLSIEGVQLARGDEGLELILEAAEPLRFEFERLAEGRHLRLLVPGVKLAAELPDLATGGGPVETVSSRQGDDGWVLDVWVAEGTRAQAHTRGNGRVLALSLVPPAGPVADRTEGTAQAPDAPDDEEVTPAASEAPVSRQSDAASVAEPEESATAGPAKREAAGGGQGQGAGEAPRRTFRKDRNATAGASMTRRIDQARSMLRQGEPAEAVAILRSVLEIDASRHAARTLLARAYMARRQPQAAVAVLEDGLALDPAHAPFALQLARLLAGAGRTEQALALLDRYEPEDPGGEYLALIGALSQQAGRYQRAAAAYRRAVAENPDNAGWWVGLAISLEGRGSPDDALASYREGLGRGDLRPALEAYARQRVDRLSRQ